MESDRDRKRRHPRVAVHVPVRVSSIDPELDPRTGRPYFRSSRDYCANLSPGGAFIQTEDPLSPGRRVLVEIHVPEREPIEAVGRVAWSRTVLGPGARPGESGVGVEFLGGNRDALSVLADYLGLPPDPPRAPDA